MATQRHPLTPVRLYLAETAGRIAETVRARTELLARDFAAGGDTLELAEALVQTIAQHRAYLVAGEEALRAADTPALIAVLIARAHRNLSKSEGDRRQVALGVIGCRP